MRSDAAKKGVERAPHRALFRALGLTTAEIERPMIGVVSAESEIVPGHIHLGAISQAVKAGKSFRGHFTLIPRIAESRSSCNPDTQVVAANISSGLFEW